MPERKPQINIVVDPAQKDRWEDYLDEEDSGVRNLSQLIRRSVEKEINHVDGAQGSIPEDLAERLSDLTEGVNRVENRLHDLDNRVANVEREVSEDPDVKKLASEVFAVLPTKDEIIEYEKTAHHAGATPDEPISKTGRAHDLAIALDEEEYRIAEALSQLQQDTHQVNTMVVGEEVQGLTVDGETRYYKEA